MTSLRWHSVAPGVRPGADPWGVETTTLRLIPPITAGTSVSDTPLWKVVRPRRSTASVAGTQFRIGQGGVLLSSRLGDATESPVTAFAGASVTAILAVTRPNMQPELAVATATTSGGLHFYEPSAQLKTSVTLPDGTHPPVDLDVDAAGTALYGADPTGNGVLEVDLSTLVCAYVQFSIQNGVLGGGTPATPRAVATTTIPGSTPGSEVEVLYVYVDETTKVICRVGTNAPTLVDLHDVDHRRLGEVPLGGAWSQRPRAPVVAADGSSFTVLPEYGLVVRRFPGGGSQVVRPPIPPPDLVDDNDPVGPTPPFPDLAAVGVLPDGMLCVADGKFLYVIDPESGATTREVEPTDKDLVDLAVDPERGDVWVITRTGLFRWRRTSGALAELPDYKPLSYKGQSAWRPAPCAIACDGDTLLVADLQWPLVLRLDHTGTVVEELRTGDVTHPRFAGWRPSAMHTQAPTVVVRGPFDGFDHQRLWHEVIVDADIPTGCAVEVSTAATDTLVTPTTWSPTRTLDATSADGRVAVLAGTGASDRGRYLYVRVLPIVRSSPDRAWAEESPTVHAVHVRGPRPVVTRFLPARWSEPDAGGSGDNFANRFLTAFAEVFGTLEARYEDVPRLLTPATAPEPWLDTQASWLGWTFDPTWSVSAKRALLAEAMTLHAQRGTRPALERILEIYTGLKPAVVESFQRVLRTRARVGEFALGRAVVGTPDPIELRPHHADVYVVLAPHERDLRGPVVHALVQRETPATADVDVHIVSPDARVGLQSTVGIDLVLGGPPPAPVLGQSQLALHPPL